MLALSINAYHRLIDAGYGNGCIPRARSHPTGEEQASFAAAGNCALFPMESSEEQPAEISP
jgi:hypothetical protein